MAGCKFLEALTETRYSVANYLFIYRGGDMDESNYSAEEIQQIMQKWHEWIGMGFQQGWLKDPGDALMPGGKIVNPKKVVSDGPFPESKELVGGYTVIQADSIEKAAELAKGCPILLSNGSVEVRELAGMAPPPAEG
jgi:hypothetical protein